MHRIIMTLFLGFVLVGCITPHVTYPENKDTSKAAVVVSIQDNFFGSEYNYLGANIGAEKDLIMITNMLSQVTDNIIVLKNGNATKKTIREALDYACRHELAMFFYTGHGYREKSKDPYETDGYDEYMILADETMTDNELWDCFQVSTNRVFCMFNCCNGATMFRTTKNEDDSIPEFTFSSKNDESQKFDLISWSGSSEDGPAVTTFDGGLFVQCIYSIVTTSNYEETYDGVWASLYPHQYLFKKQKPTRIYVGKSFGRNKVFR